jgi:hypothetical protein
MAEWTDLSFCGWKQARSRKYKGEFVTFWTMRPLDDASLGRCVPWKMRPLDFASLERCVPWTMRPLDDASLGRCVPLTMRLLDNASLTVLETLGQTSLKDIDQ